VLLVRGSTEALATARRVAERLDMPAVSEMDHYVSCPACGAQYEFATDPVMRVVDALTAVEAAAARGRADLN
jgi:hypothetical protein